MKFNENPNSQNKGAFSKRSKTEIIAAMQKDFGPLKFPNGVIVPNTGRCYTMMKQTEIKTLLDGCAEIEREGKWALYEFSVDSKRYSMLLEIHWNATVEVVIRFDHNTPFNACDYLTASDLWEGR